GNRTNSRTTQGYEIINGQAKVKTVTSHTDVANIDGSRSVAEGSVDSVVTYTYGDRDGKKGILIGAMNTVPGVTVMDDGFGNRTASRTTQGYEIINGQAKVKTVTSHTDIVNIDGSRSLTEGSVDSVVTYTYGDRDGKKGILIGAMNTAPGVTVMDDGFGNRTNSRTTQTYEIINGQAKVKTVTSHTDIVNIDGSRSLAEVSADSVVSYEYGDRDGKKGILIGAMNTVPGVTVMDDGFGNRSLSRTQQTYEIVNGQAKVKTVTTHTDAINIDGSRSVAEESVDSVVSYTYGDRAGRKGILTGAENTVPGVTVMDDGFGNRTTSRTTQGYEIINGQAKVKTVTSHTDIVNIDGSRSLTEGSVDSVVTYTYGDRDGKKGILIAAMNTTPGVTVMDDGFGNRTASRTTQSYEIVNGQAKVKTVTSHTDVNNIDGSRSVAEGSVDSVVTYIYGDRDGKKGILIGAMNTTPGVTVMDDGFGNRTASLTTQSYEIINGQAKVKTVTSHTDVNNIDGSRSVAEGSVDSVVTYTYGDRDGKKGILVGAMNSTPGVTVMDDGFGNRTASRTTQVYEIINGQAKVKTVTSHTDVNNSDGSRSVADGSVDSVVTYEYGDRDGKKGILIAAMNTVPGVTVMDDGFGNRTNSRTTQTYEIVNGQAKVKTVTSHTELNNIDGSRSLAEGSVDSVVTYSYGDRDGKKGILVGAMNSTPGVTVMDDGFGNRTVSRTTQTYEIVNGQAKAKTITSHTDIMNIDGSRSVAEGSVDSVVTYTYGTDRDGRRGVLVRAENSIPGVTVMDDGFGNRTASRTTQTYDILNGQAKVKTVTSHTDILNIDGSRSVAEGSVDSVVTYTYGDRDGKKGILIGATNTTPGVTAMDDGFGNRTASLTTQTYEILNGQAKVKTVTSHTDITNIDGSRSVAEGSVDSIVTYTYGDRDGKKGILIGAMNTTPGVTVMDDGFGNRTASLTTQTYEIINGQAKVKTVTSHTDIVNIDGSRSVAEGSVDSVVTYTYGDRDGKKGILIGAVNTTPGVTIMDDGFGNRTSSRSAQSYEIVNGQAKVKTVSSHTDIVNIDGSRSLAEGSVDSVVTYSYGDRDGKKGILIGAMNTTPGVTVMDDGFGNRSASRSAQTFEIVNGQAKVKTVINHTEIVNMDGSRSLAEGSVDSVVTSWMTGLETGAPLAARKPLRS
ncbi:MAG: hypothetical protein HYY63_00650, partial [Elusimicrobia bacterium]|nr:hypothetical protein [Elusimicrobiota bacterium]